MPTPLITGAGGTPYKPNTVPWKNANNNLPWQGANKPPGGQTPRPPFQPPPPLEPPTPPPPIKPSIPPPIDLSLFKQEPLPPVPYFDDPPKTAKTPSPRIAPTTPPARPSPLSIPKGATPPPLPTNPVPTIAPPSGGTAAVITTTASGVITGAGVVTGGLALVAGGLLLHNANQLIKLFRLSQPESKPIPQPLRGGQDPNKAYILSGTVTEICTLSKDIAGYWHQLTYIDTAEISWIFNNYTPRSVNDSSEGFQGPITLLTKVGQERRGNNGGIDIEYGSNKRRVNLYNDNFELKGLHDFPFISSSDRGNSFGIPAHSIRQIISIDLVATPLREAAPKPQSLPLQRSPIKSNIAPNADAQSTPSLKPNGVRSPTSAPPVINPLPTNNRIPYKITTPGAAPITIRSPGATPVTITPASSPATIKITRPSASPFLSPTPANTPAATPVTTPSKTPATTPAGVPIAVSSPGATPTELVMPGTNPITITYPGQTPIVIDPSTSKPPEGVQAVPIPGAFTTTPLTPTKPATTPTTPTKPGTPTTPTIPGVKDPDLDDIGLKLVGLTALIQGISKNTNPTSIQNAVGPAIAPAVCSTTAPGGCSSNMTNSAVGKGVEDLKDFLKKNGLDALAQVEQLKLLNRLDSKMGAQMPGGVAGAFGRLSSFLGIDRIFNLINFMANLHNAFMLSNSLKITLLEMLSSVGNATGLLQSSEGENVDLNAVYDKGIKTLINSVLGDEQAARLEIQFRRANRIYQATTNSLNAVSGMMSSLGNVIEVSAEYGGKVGNALKAAGAVHEKAYQWMAEKFDAKVSPFMKYSQSVNGVNTALETINEIAESVVEGQQSATEFQKANKDFLTAVAEVKKDPGIENKAVAAEVAKQKENATKDPTGEDETGLLSFLTDL